MSAPSFVHLHLKSQFSLLESTVRFEPLFTRLKELGMPAVALTDKANLFGAIAFYQGALAHGLKPILGCELQVVSGSRFDKAPGRPETVYPLVVLAENEEGYRNLMQLSSAGYLQGFLQTPRVDKDLLARHAKGLLALSGGPEGEAERFLLKEEMPLALKAAGEYAEIFGKDRFFLEVQDHRRPIDALLRKKLTELSSKSGLPLVAANDVRYLRREEAPFHEVLLCLGQGQVLSDPKHPNLGSDEHFLRSAEEMAAVFKEIPEALQRTVAIAERCHLDLAFGKTILPSFPVPDPGLDEAGYLEKLCTEALERRYGPRAPGDPEIRGRMKEELSVIRKTGFSGYFLIVWDFIAKAKAKGIPVGPGRGSAAGSLVSYLLGITEVDPLKYDLLFERFINPERVSAPDIDVDVCDRRRQEVLDYITQTYGKERVASIVTFGTMAAKAVVRDVGRVLEVPLPEVDRIAKLIPFEPKITLEDAMEKVPELKAIGNEQGPHRRLWDVARGLEGLVRHVSTHAAGILIGKDPLLENIPLCTGAHGEVLTQYEMNALKEVGLLKLDILGLRTLSVIDDTLRLVREAGGEALKPEAIPLEDPAAFRLLKEAKTFGIFQLESRGMRDYMRKLAPSTMEDLIALLALYRPGPLGSDMVDDFIHRKKGQVKVEYLHPKLEPILRPTYGVILYQEQVMRIAKDLAGFTLGQADLLRRAMGSKNPEKMEQMRGKFIAGAKQRGVPESAAESIFNQMAKFAGYGFNKSHSAAYALVAYWTAYLKARHPREFMAALLTSESGNQERISQYVFECRKLGLKVLPPDVNLSSDNFRVVPEGIRFSLSAIKNVGTPAVASLLAVRDSGGPFKSLADFCRRVDLRSFTPKMLESLVLAGTFDSTGAGRAAMKAGLEKVFRQAQADRADSQSGQTSLFGSPGGEAEGELPAVEELNPAEALMAEKEVLGFYLSGHPLSEHEWELEHFVLPLNEMEEAADGSEVRVAGLIRSLSQSILKRTQEPYGRFVLEDLHSFVEVIAWPEVFKAHRGLLAKDKLVALKGKVDRSGDRVQVVASEVIALSEMAARWAKAVRLNLNLVGFDDALLGKVLQLCQAHPGKAKVLLNLQTTHHGVMVMEAGEGSRVQPTGAFLRKAHQLLGEDCVGIEF